MKRKNNLKTWLISPLWYITALPMMGCFEKQRGPNKSANTFNSPANANTPPNAPGKNKTLPTPEGTVYPTHTDTLSKTERNESSRPSTVKPLAGSNATASVNAVPKIAQAHGRDANTEATQIRSKLEDACNKVECYINCILDFETIYKEAMRETEMEAYLEMAIEAIEAVRNIQVPKNKLPLLESLDVLLQEVLTIRKRIITLQNLRSKLLEDLDEVLTNAKNARNVGAHEVPDLYRVAQCGFNALVTRVKNATAGEVQMMQGLKKVIELSKVSSLNNSMIQNEIVNIDKKIKVIKELENEVNNLSSFTPKSKLDLASVENICKSAKEVYKIGSYKLKFGLISVERSLLIIGKNVLQLLKATP